MWRVRFLLASVHRDRVSTRVSLLLVFDLAVSLVSGLVRDRRLRLQGPGEGFHLLTLPPASILFSLLLCSGGIPVRPSGEFLAGILRRWELGMQVVDPRNLGIVEGLKISTLNERTGACISPRCHS